jgi:hypothetical protein
LLGRVSTLIIYLSCKYYTIDFLYGSVNLIVKLYALYQSVYCEINIMKSFSWWNCTRGGVDLRTQKPLITHNVNSPVGTYISTVKGKGWGTQ